MTTAPPGAGFAEPLPSARATRAELDLEALRRFVLDELNLARLGASHLALVEVDDIVDAVLLDDWSRWGRTDGPLSARLLSEVRARIHRVAQRPDAAATEDLEDDWLRDNSAFWPDRDWISFEERLGDDDPDPQTIAELLEALSTEERRAILLSHRERWPLPDIAAALGADCARVERLLESAVEKLARAYLAS